MILGLGIDLVEVARIEASVERFGSRFLERIFTGAERRYCAAKRFPAQHLAARFAAKEAGAKALGTGISRGVGWQDFEVQRQPGKAPQLALSGRALELGHLLGVSHIALSVTHTALHATAIVIFEDGAIASLPR